MKKLAIGIALLISFPTLAADQKSLIYDIRVKYNIEQPVILAPRDFFLKSFGMKDGIDTHGFYDEKRNHIVIANTLPDKYLKRVILHEVGHSVFENQLTEQQRQSWCKRYETRIVSPTVIGRKDCVESFVESYYFRKYDWWATLIGAESLWEIKILDTLK